MHPFHQLLQKTTGFFRTRTTALLVLLIAVSVAVRIPFLVRPLSGHHEWLTSTSLIHIQAFYEQGFTRLHFSPCMSYVRPADKNINFHPNLSDAAGNMYYLSFPPFAFLMPAFVFRLLHVYPTPVLLRIWNLLFHIVNCFLVFGIVGSLTRRLGPRARENSALLGFTVYLFSPAALWFQSNVYMSDMFVQLFFLLGIWLYRKIDEQERVSGPYLALFFANLFLFVYTEWLGVFFAAAVFAVSLVRIRKASSRALLPVIVFGTLAPAALTLWQYSRIAGFPPLMDYWKAKFLSRTGDPRYAFGRVGFLTPTAWLNIIVNYVGGFLPFLALWACLGIRSGQTAAIRERNSNPEAKAILALAVLPVLMHHLVFFNFTVIHDFSALKGGVFIAIIVSLIYAKLLVRTVPTAGGLKNPAVLTGVAVALALVQFVLINSFGASDKYRTVGQAIRRDARDDEVVFVSGVNIYPEPQYIVYARRNLAGWAGEAEAARILKLNGSGQGVLFELNRAGDGFDAIRRFRLTRNRILYKDRP